MNGGGAAPPSFRDPPAIAMSSAFFFAHSADGVPKERWHRLADHLRHTGDRAAAFLERSGCGAYARVAGMLHDLGKYTPEFQRRLSGDPRRVDHSTAGAQLASDRYGNLVGRILAFCIAGHHAGLANGAGDGKVKPLMDRLGATVPALDSAWEEEVSLPSRIPPPPLNIRSADTAAFSAFMLVRMVFSALVDADYLDTEQFYAEIEGATRPRGQHPPVSDLSTRLDLFLAGLTRKAEATPVNRLRQRVLECVRSKADESPGLFSLTVPTGGGKTLTSLAFALDHARRHGLARVIYVIPFTSVVEQTAEVFRRALGGGEPDEADFVVEHHSVFDEDRVQRRESRDKLRLAMENWDAPIIVTTAVQFFESLFANRPSRSRKVHRIANSVVILDEAQTLPLKLLRPCVAALDELTRNWNTTAVLCTATQPALSEAAGFPGGFQQVRELAPDPRGLYEELRRTRVRRREQPFSDTDLAEHLRDERQVLCIVNSRRHARELFQAIADAEGASHLTTTMCAAHRREVLTGIRGRLDAGKPVRLVATSLVEAGVDLDFPVVWRAEAGLEAIVQAAGRCNREGRNRCGDVWVFEPDGWRSPPETSQFADAARSILRRDDGDPLSLEALQDYFREIYWIKESELDAMEILSRVEERRPTLLFPFEDIARDFRIIEDVMVPVIVPWRSSPGGKSPAEAALAHLEDGASPGLTARRLQPFVVPVPRWARARLLDAGAVSEIGAERYERQFTILDNMDLYDSAAGLSWEDPTYRSDEGLIL